uniref:Methylated-DNA--protein-cysteine methyltransferase n=2 Tax=Plectus sambesii TaxID=2011161 RepID=A0A914V9K6_9BILA
MACHRKITCAVVHTPIGKLHLFACTAGLHEVCLAQSTITDNFTSEEKLQLVVMETKDVSNKVLQESFIWLQMYFSREKARMMPPLCMSTASGDESFMVKCWKTLEEQVPFGRTITYGLLAGMTDRPKAARAVGQAMRRNKWILFVPCHRVMRSDGSLGQYSGGGITVKRWLIDFEKSR